MPDSDSEVYVKKKKKKKSLASWSGSAQKWLLPLRMLQPPRFKKTGQVAESYLKKNVSLMEINWKNVTY